jgi:hypothetical protein
MPSVTTDGTPEKKPFTVTFTYEDHPTALSDAVRAFVKVRVERDFKELSESQDDWSTLSNDEKAARWQQYRQQKREGQTDV